MLETKRPGSIAVSSSSRDQVTALAGSAPTFFVMKTRPVIVAAHAVDESAAVRSTAETPAPARSPQTALVRPQDGVVENIDQAIHATA